MDNTMREVAKKSRQKSLRFGKVFLKESGLDARLHTKEADGIDDTVSDVIYSLSLGNGPMDNNSMNIIKIEVIGSKAYVSYSRTVARSDDEFVEVGEDLKPTIEKIARNYGMGVSLMCPEQDNSHVINIFAQIDTRGYSHKPRVFGDIERIMSDYFHNSDRLSLSNNDYGDIINLLLSMNCGIRLMSNKGSPLEQRKEFLDRLGKKYNELDDFFTQKGVRQNKLFNEALTDLEKGLGAYATLAKSNSFFVPERHELAIKNVKLLEKVADLIVYDR